MVKITHKSYASRMAPKHLFDFPTYFIKVERWFYKNNKVIKHYRETEFRQDLLWLDVKVLLSFFQREWAFRYALGALGLIFFIKTGNPAFIFFMGPVAFDAASTGSTSTPGTTLSFSHTTTGSDRILVGLFHPDSGDAVGTATYNSVSMTVVGTAGSNADRRCRLLRLAAPATGANTIAFTSDISSNLIGGAVSFTGSDGTMGTVVTNTGGGAAGTSTTIDVTSATDDIVIAGITLGTSKAYTPGASQTERYELNDGGPNFSGACDTEAGATTVTMSGTFSSSFFGHIGSSVKSGTQAGAANQWLLMGV